MSAQLSHEFFDELKEKTARVNALIEPFYPEKGSFNAEVVEAMNYSLRAGGKRLRPMFILETLSMYGGDVRRAAPFMAALEMIHTYSLVHDDLPEMDNDEYRRGLKTTWAVYGQGMAVLAGDGLLNYAYETAAGALAAAEDETGLRRAARALSILAGNAGISGMVGGQCADLMSEAGRRPESPELLRYIHTNKTARMIASGLTIGAVLAGAPDEDVRKLDSIADAVGIAFQIRDDLLDVEGDAAVLGKATGQDALDGKMTYITVFGMDKAKEDVVRYTEDALVLFDALTASNPFLRNLLISLVDRDR